MLTIGAFFAYSGKVRLKRALRDCKQRSLTVSKKAPTVSKKASPLKKLQQMLRVVDVEGYEWRCRFVTKIPADLVFQACISFLRCFSTPGTPIRKILVHTGMLPLSCPFIASNLWQIRISSQSRSHQRDRASKRSITLRCLFRPKSSGHR